MAILWIYSSIYPIFRHPNRLESTWVHWPSRFGRSCCISGWRTRWCDPGLLCNSTRWHGLRHQGYLGRLGTGPSAPKIGGFSRGYRRTQSPLSFFCATVLGRARSIWVLNSCSTNWAKRWGPKPSHFRVFNGAGTDCHGRCPEERPAPLASLHLRNNLPVVELCRNMGVSWNGGTPKSSHF